MLGKQVKPTPTMSTENSPTINNNAECTSWMKNNSASCFFMATIEKTFWRSLINCKSSQKMCDRLKAQNEQAVFYLVLRATFQPGKMLRMQKRKSQSSQQGFWKKKCWIRFTKMKNVQKTKHFFQKGQTKCDP